MKTGASKWMKSKWNDPSYRKKISLLSSERMRQHHKDGKIKHDTFTGKKHSEESKIKMSNAKINKGIGSNNSQFGTCWIIKEGVSKKIKKEELENYVALSWKKGRV
jgi:hypothetical protein